MRETTGSHLFGGTSLMYAYWFPVGEQKGDTLLLVSFELDSLDTGPIRRCEAFGPVEEQFIQLKGTRVRPYYTRAAFHYRAGGFHSER